MHTIRKGEPRDIAAIAVIYDRILDREERGGASTGWIRGVYPTADTARAALEAGELFVMEREGRGVVAGRINHEQCPQYAAVSWTEAETPDEQVLVLHTLVSDPLVAGLQRHGVRRPLRTIRPRARLHLAPDRHERAQRLRAPPVRPPRLS